MDSWVASLFWLVWIMPLWTWICKYLFKALLSVLWIYTQNLLNHVASLMAQLVKNQPAMRETWVWSLGWEDPLEKGTTTYSSILAWRIPWTEEPGRLQSMGSQRIGHNWETITFTSPKLTNYICKNSFQIGHILKMQMDGHFGKTLFNRLHSS